MFADALLTLLCAFAIGLLFYGPWQTLCTDVGRQIIFEQRDALFDLARTGRIEFDSPVYREVRHDLEQLIRFAHELTLPRMIYLSTVPVVRERSHQLGVIDVVSKLTDKDLERDISRLVVRSYSAAIVMMTTKSIVVVILIPAIAIVLMIGAARRVFRRKSKSYIVKIGGVIQAEAACTSRS